MEILPRKPGPKIQLIRQQMQRKIYTFFVNSASDIATAIRKKHLGKAKKEEETFVAAYAAIKWTELVEAIQSDLDEIAKIAGQAALSQLDILNEEQVSEVNNLAEDYAKTRTEDMVGEGTRYSIADATKDDLKAVIEEAESNSDPLLVIASELKEAEIFSRARSSLIASTEASMALVHNHLEIWKRSGKVKSVDIQVSPEHDVDDICDELQAGSPYPIDKCPIIPSHPNCRCSIVAHELVQ
jgi:hypothetical protein